MEKNSRGGGPWPGTMRNWFLGDTMRPNVTTVRAALRAAGCDLVIVRRVVDLGRPSKSDNVVPFHRPRLVRAVKKAARKKRAA